MDKLLYFLLIFVLVSCATKAVDEQVADEELEVIEFVYELVEIEPLPEKKKVEVIIVPKEYEYISSGVAEVEEIDGVQKFFYIKLGYSRAGIKQQMEGKIFNDLDQKEQIGTFKLVEVFKDFSKAQILELNFKLTNDATVLFEIEKED